MRHSRLLLIAAALAVCANADAAEDVATASVSVNLNLAPRTSLKISSNVLHFNVTRPGEIATAVLDFSAGARMPANSDVVLTVEPVAGLDGPGGSAHVDGDISFVGEGDGMLTGSFARSECTAVGRWQGSGRRDGRVIFKLRANATGSYSLPVRVVLSTP